MKKKIERGLYWWHLQTKVFREAKIRKNYTVENTPKGEDCNLKVIK